MTGFKGKSFGFGNATTLGSGRIGIHYLFLPGDAVIIAMITADASWNNDGEYTGLYTGLAAGDIYIDETNHLRYEYDGVKLIRSQIDDYTG